MGDDLICNFKDCRKRLKTFAWVTSCSHVFCEEDGSREFENHQVCPACETTLTGQYDIVKSELRPSEEYKSMILAGHRPEIIMEICSRAMSFWTYQTHLERAYHEYLSTKATEKAKQQESYYEHLVAVTQSEVACLKTQVASIQKELELVKSKYNETSEKLLEKNRQYQKLQGIYEALRRRNVTPASFEGEEDKSTPRRKLAQFRQFEIPLGGLPDKEAFLPHGLSKKPAQDSVPVFTVDPVALTTTNLAPSGKLLADHRVSSDATHQKQHRKKETNRSDSFSFKAHPHRVPGGSLFQRSK